MDFQLLEILKSLATFRQEEDGQGTVAMKATGRRRRGDSAILTQSLPQVFLRPLAAFQFTFWFFVLDMAPGPGHFTTLCSSAWN